MFKKPIDHGKPEQLRDLEQNRWRSLLKKMSCGAAQITRIMTCSHKDQWRRKGKHQNQHDRHPHKFHRDR